jgi:hypothetical protein
MPLAEPPPRDSRFGSPLKFSRVHWVRPEVVVEATYLTWTEDILLRQVSYQGQRGGQASKTGRAECPASSAVLKLRLVAAWQQFLRHYYRQIAGSNGRAPKGKGGPRVEVVTPAAIGANNDDLDIVFQEVNRM